MNSGRVTAAIEYDPSGRPRGFSLHLGGERTTLEPHQTWAHADRHKWATRGLIEPPQSFAVHSDGSVSYNGEAYDPTDPAQAESLAAAVNKRHAPEAPPRPKVQPRTAGTGEPGRVRFRVHLDSLGHLLVQASRGAERTETGIRGLTHLASDGWMLPPGQLHIDPLQRYLDLDGTRFACDRAGALALEAALNAHYVPASSGGDAAAIEVRENPGASTGFDIHFWTVRAGTRFEIKGHLAQDKLDILQDHDKCDLLESGVILRLSPPVLYFRRRRADGGEEPIPGIPDVRYRSVSAAELQRLLNLPGIRRGGGKDTSSTTPGSAETPAPAPGGPVPAAPPASRPAPPPEPPAVPRVPEPPVAQRPPVQAPPSPSGRPPVAGGPSPAAIVPPQEPLDPAAQALFAVTDPWTVNRSVFHRLAERLQRSPEAVLFSLPRIFEDREFEILNLGEGEVEGVLHLRSDRFYGFYISHVGPERIDLVYACHGTHVEFGTDKCVLQPSAGAESLELRGPGLRGLAQDANHHFVFVVDPRFREFARPHDRSCAEAFAHFITVADWARRHDGLAMVWPVPPP